MSEGDGAGNSSLREDNDAKDPGGYESGEGGDGGDAGGSSDGEEEGGVSAPESETTVPPPSNSAPSCQAASDNYWGFRGLSRGLGPE